MITRNKKRKNFNLPMENLQNIPTIHRIITSQFLDDKDINRLSTISKFFYRETKDVFYWEAKLIQAGCKQEVLKKLIQTKVIQDYQKLFVNFTSMNPHYSQIESVWQLLCLSGEIKAIQYAIDKEKVDSTFLNQRGFNPLHFVAMSGSLDAMKFIISHPSFKGLNASAITHEKWNVLHIAMLRGEIEVIKFILSAPFFEKLDFCAETSDFENVLHLAAHFGLTDIIRIIISDPRFRNLDPNKARDMGDNALHLAIWGYSFESTKLILTEPFFKDLDRLDTRFHGYNALHIAAMTGQVETVITLLQNTKLDPNTKDKEGHNAFWHAEHSKNAKKIKESLCAYGQNSISHVEDSDSQERSLKK